MQINKEEITQISYDYQQSKMIIKLKKKKLINRFMSDEVAFNCNEKAFKNSVKNLYSKEDKENGFIIAKDRFNTQRSFNLLSVSSAIIEINSNSNLDDFDSVLSKLKKASKNSSLPISHIF